MEISNSMKTVLTRLRLSPVLHTLPDRLAYARNAASYHALGLQLRALTDDLLDADAIGGERRPRKTCCAFLPNATCWPTSSPSLSSCWG